MFLNWPLHKQLRLKEMVISIDIYTDSFKRMIACFYPSWSSVSKLQSGL